MAKVIETIRGETVHTVQLNQRELDIIVGLLGQCQAGGETYTMYRNLMTARHEDVKFQTFNGGILPCIKIKGEEND